MSRRLLSMEESTSALYTICFSSVMILSSREKIWPDERIIQERPA